MSSTAKELPRWAHAIDPPPDWTMASEKRVGAWLLEARWWGWADQADGPNGPREVVVRPAEDAHPFKVRNGVTAGAMRFVAPALSDLIAESGETETDRRFRAAVADEAARLLPEGGPRADPGKYYAGLLHLFDIIDAVSEEPLNELTRVLGIPKNTLKSQLRIAREHGTTTDVDTGHVRKQQLKAHEQPGAEVGRARPTPSLRTPGAHLGYIGNPQH